jgi:hypothetical protein
MCKLHGRSPSVKVSVNVRGRNAKANVNVNVRPQPEQSRKLLKFGQGNAKLPPWVTTFSLPAGWSCPFAKDCRSFADRETGKVTDGPHTVFRCYKSSEEARYKTSRENSWHNFDLLRSCRTSEEMVELILDSLLPGTPVVRIHTGGDFFSQRYFDAWLEVARQRPRTTFYFYTKSLRYWVARLGEVGDGHMPGTLPNVIPTASQGGSDDVLINAHGLRSALVVYSEAESAALGLEVDHDDSHAMRHGPSFSLLIHGTQPASSEAAKAVAILRSQGEFGYGEKANTIRAQYGRLPLVTAK